MTDIAYAYREKPHSFLWGAARFVVTRTICGHTNDTGTEFPFGDWPEMTRERAKELTELHVLILSNDEKLASLLLQTAVKNLPAERNIQTEEA